MPTLGGRTGSLVPCTFCNLRYSVYRFCTLGHWALVPLGLGTLGPGTLVPLGPGTPGPRYPGTPRPLGPSILVPLGSCYLGSACCLESTCYLGSTCHLGPPVVLVNLLPGVHRSPGSTGHLGPPVVWGPPVTWVHLLSGTHLLPGVNLSCPSSTGPLVCSVGHPSIFSELGTLDQFGTLVTPCHSFKRVTEIFPATYYNNYEGPPISLAPLHSCPLRAGLPNCGKTPCILLLSP